MPDLPAGRAAIRSLEERNLSTWPGLAHGFVDGWVLRRSGDSSRRANCAWPLHAAAGPLEARLAAAEGFFAAGGLDPVVRITPLAEPSLDAALAAHGYRAEDPSLVRLVPLARGLDADRSGLAIAESPDAWLDGHARLSGSPAAAQALAATIHGLIAVPCGYVLVVEAGRAVGCGFAAVDRGIACIYSIKTDPGLRRRGIAGRVMRALLAWAAGAGASAAMLQVQGDNLPALALYTRLGFRTVYGYHYRARRSPGRA